MKKKDGFHQYSRSYYSASFLSRSRWKGRTLENFDNIREKRSLSLSVEEGIFRNSRQSGKKRSPRKVLKKSEKKREQHFPSRAPQENSKVLAPGGMAVKLRNLFRVLPRTSRAAIPTDRCLTEKFSRPLYAPLLSPTEFHPRFQRDQWFPIHSHTCIFT